MAINQKQVLSLQQKLSPQQIQMIKLLELPTVQLEQRIKQEIEDNIVLEEEDRAAEDEEQPQQISVDEYLREDDTPSYKSRINNYSKDDKQRPVFLTEGRSLQEYLIEQLGFRNLSEREMKLAVYLVGSIDEDGYLRRDLESVADDIAFTLGIETSAEELERLLGVLHELEPAGIGARNLRAIAWLIHQKFELGIPLYRQEKECLQFPCGAGLFADVQPPVRTGGQCSRRQAAPSCAGAVGRGGQHRAGAKLGKAGGGHPLP